MHQHILENPNFPHAVGYPIVAHEGDTVYHHSDVSLYAFSIGTEVKPKSVWTAERLGGFNFEVINTRRFKEWKRQDYVSQIMVDAAPGKWWFAGHFYPV